MTSKTEACQSQPLDIAYYSDVLCVWAYVAQVRLIELKANFGDKIDIHPYQVTLFGDVEKRMQDGWADRGLYKGFAEHVEHVCEQFPHVELNKSVWWKCRPVTSGTAHLFLKAVELYEQAALAAAPEKARAAELYKNMEWAFRLAFFQDGRDISQTAVLFDIAKSYGIGKQDIKQYLNDGTAVARFTTEMAMKETYKLDGSPTYMFNNKRQKLFGNVGYKILHANVSELLENRSKEIASWC